jgi:hypothetical protein
MRLRAILVLLMIPGAIALTTPQALSQVGYFEPTRLVTQDIPSTSPLTPPLYNFQEALEDEEKLRGVLRMMREGLPDDLREMFRQIRAGGGQEQGNVSRGLSGLGGIFGHAMLKAAEAKAPGGEYDPNLRVTIDSRGHIDGYFFDHQRRSGYLNVTTEITVGYPNGNIDVDRYRYEVEIGNNTFRPIEKDTSNPDDVFPGTDLPISAAMAAGFNYKLWAKGAQIRVRRLWIDHNDNGIFEPDERVGPGIHGDWRDGYRHLLRADPDACIDMMFAHYPPETLPPGAAPPFYCLGRCAFPPLINTK